MHGDAPQGGFLREWFVPPRWGSGGFGYRKPGVAPPSAAPPLAINRAAPLGATGGRKFRMLFVILRGWVEK